MTVKELKNILETYSDDQFIHMRLWLNPNKDYLDDEVIQVVVGKVQQGISGAVLITGSDE